MIKHFLLIVYSLAITIINCILFFLIVIKICIELLVDDLENFGVGIFCYWGFIIFILCIYISSSSYRAGSTDIPDPLSPLLPIVHRPR